MYHRCEGNVSLNFSLNEVLGGASTSLTVLCSVNLTVAAAAYFRTLISVPNGSHYIYYLSNDNMLPDVHIFST